MQEKAARVNQLTNERRRKDEMVKGDRIEREQLLQNQNFDDDVHFAQEAAKKVEFAQKLRQMHEVNLRTEQQRNAEQRRQQLVNDKEAVVMGIQISDLQ